MRRTVLFLLLALALTLAGCQGVATPQATAGSPVRQPQDGGGVTAAQLLEALLAVCPESGRQGLERVAHEDLAGQVEGFYGLDEGMWADAAIARLGGASVFEIAVIVLDEDAGEQDISKALDCLSDYLTARQGDFTGYAPDQAELVESSQLLACGRYLALVISEGADRAASVFFDSFSDNPAEVYNPSTPSIPSAPSSRYPYTDPKRDDMTIYDTSAILTAWESGDRSRLSPKDRAILEAAEKVLAEVLQDGMTGYEKERSLYNWVLTHMEYDWDHQDQTKEMDPDSSNPYGGLVNGKGICLGFATTFQLLMDMAGVECITVVGAAFRSTENHAWNMVRLDGQWTCVDATWDEAAFAPEFWNYFNFSSDWMAETDHQWDYEAVPEGCAYPPA